MIIAVGLLFKTVQSHVPLSYLPSPAHGPRLEMAKQNACEM